MEIIHNRDHWLQRFVIGVAVCWSDALLLISSLSRRDHK